MLRSEGWHNCPYFSMGKGTRFALSPTIMWGTPPPPLLRYPLLDPLKCIGDCALAKGNGWLTFSIFFQCKEQT